MGHVSLDKVIRHLRISLISEGSGALADGELLDRVVGQHDAWTEGMGWQRGGSVVWQVYDKDGKPTALRGHAGGVPVWSLVAVFVRPDGRFAIVY